ncbi:type II secretion system protein GspL [Paraferrimonas haliotis]|uniref:Type II secretion system protein L n=1 Tax=Paraferrimonas haliotis TaxID=2013866 RepID=A0AA37WYS7_9GAMM|nr:type II secretion system protein GspL [Paraferrimonas haliotis]GLS83466.1 type II secretion system protein L [Paraferrimonas haliotis]
MSEQVTIRLGRDYDQPIQWLVYSSTEDEVIASGEIANAEELNQLTERCAGKTVDVLVPASSLTLTTVTLPEKGHRQALKALPFMLEEELAQDVEQLHFVVGPIEGNQASVAVVAKQLMAGWLAWLADAEISARRIVVDALALPWQPQQWSMVEMDGQWLIRQQQAIALAVDKSWLTMIAAKTVAHCAEQEVDTPVVAAYSPLDLPMMDVQQQTLELPMLTLAKGAASAPMNLLVGEFAPKREYFKHIQVWKKVAAVLVVCFVLGVINNGIQWYRYSQQAQQTQQQSIDIYKKMFNSTPRAGLLRTQIDSKLRELQGGQGGSQVFAIMDTLDPAFDKVPQLKLTGIRYDANRGELRLSIKAPNFSQVEQFEQLAKEDFQVSTGSMNNSDELITGTITIKEF